MGSDVEMDDASPRGAVIPEQPNGNAEQAQAAPQPEQAVEPRVVEKPGIVLQSNPQWQAEHGHKERDDAFVLMKLDACNFQQCWDIFNKAMEAGYIVKGEVMKLEWISEEELRVDCNSKDACEKAMDIILTKYPKEEIAKQENEGPGIWRARNGYLGTRKATIHDVKPPGFKKKQRGGRAVKDYRGDVNWCKEQGVDATFATKLALKAQAEKQWAEMTDVASHEEKFEGIKQEDVVSSHHLLDMLAKKDEKTYQVNELKGKGGPAAHAQWGKGSDPNNVAMDHRGMGGLLAGDATPGGMGYGYGGKGYGKGDARDQQANSEMEAFLDFMQHESTPAGTTLYGPGGAQSTYGAGSEAGGNWGIDPYATPHSRMRQFDEAIARGDARRGGENGREDEEEFISSKRPPRGGRDNRSPPPRGGRNRSKGGGRDDSRRGRDRSRKRSRGRDRNNDRGRRDSRGREDRGRKRR